MVVWVDRTAARQTASAFSNCTCPLPRPHSVAIFLGGVSLLGDIPSPFFPRADSSAHSPGAVRSLHRFRSCAG